MMIYTIGFKDGYDFYFKEQGTPTKLGRETDYCGGSVWQSEDEARLNCPANFDVYGVLADWNKDTAISDNPEATWRDLLLTSDLVQLSKVPSLQK
jgi:hypothetical protein